MYPTMKIFFFINLVISVISVVQRETTLTISILTAEPVSMESEKVRVVSLSTLQITEVPRVKIRSPGFGYLKEKY